jgi:hypothetical protein
MPRALVPKTSDRAVGVQQPYSFLRQLTMLKAVELFLKPGGLEVP